MINSPQTYPKTRVAAAMPRGAWDCHMHVFGPFDQFPIGQAGAYTPPVADRVQHRAVLDGLGFDHALLIQPSLYGSDHRALLDAIGKSDGRLLGVGSCDASISEQELTAMLSGGIVALRFVGVAGPDGGRYPGTQGLDSREKLRPAMTAVGMHAQLWADLDLCAETAIAMAQQGMPLVLDHLAGLSPQDRPGTYRFDKMVDAMSSGLVWIKLSYLRRSAQPLDYQDMRTTVEALAAAAPDNILWGSDWPFVRMAAQPDPASLLDQLLAWLGRDAFVRCMKDNPARLFAATKSLDGKTAAATR